MSDMSDSNSSCSRTSNKQRISQIDDNIEQLTQEVNALNNFVYRTELEWSLMTLRVKREKLKALAAITKSQVLMANMQILVAEAELYTDIERLKTIKKMRLESEAGASQRHQAPTPPSTSSVSVQTTKGTSVKKKRKHSSSRKSPVDISSDETVLIPSIYESTTSIAETPQKSVTSYSQLFDKTPVSRFGSNDSLSSSVKAEFNNPSKQTQTKEIVQKYPTKNINQTKRRLNLSQIHSDKATSLSVSKQNQSQKTVAELRQTLDTASKHTGSSSHTICTPKSRPVEKNSSASATYVPAGHHNLPQLVPQPRTSAMSPAIYMKPATQTNTQYNNEPQDPRLYRSSILQS